MRTIAMKILALAMLLTTIALAQQPAKTPEDKGTAETNRAKSTAHAKSAESNQAQSTQPRQPPSQATVGTESQRNPATTGTHTQTSSQGASDEGSSTQRKLTWFTGVLAGVGVLQLIVMFLTWLVYRRQAREMRRQRHEMRRQRHVMYRQWKAVRAQVGEMAAQRGVMDGQLGAMKGQAAEMERQTDALLKSVEAANKSADAAKDNVEMLIGKERARISIDVFNLDIGSPKPIQEVGFEIKPYLPTLATILDTGVSAYLSDSKEVEEDEPLFAISIDRLLLPGSGGSIQRTTMWRPKLGLEDSDIEAIQTEKVFVHFCGFIKYRDIFGREHETRWRYIWQEYFWDLPGEWHQHGSPEDNQET
jgi:hypothetical protein